MYFYDRKDAGKKLADLLAKKYKNKDIFVYSLPRGGVVIGAEVAKVLHAPLDIIITRKIGHPYNPEYALAVLSEDGNIVGNKEEINQIDQKWFKQEIKKEKQEIERRRKLYLKDREKISVKNKIAIIVDDGIATGLTIKAAIEDVTYITPKKIIIAVPVIPNETAVELKKYVDEIVALDIDSNYRGAVGAYYRNFPQLTDEEVINLLAEKQ